MVDEDDEEKTQRMGGTTSRWLQRMAGLSISGMLFLGMGVLAGCGGGGGASPTTPSASGSTAQQLLPSVSGLYTLEITPSNVCAPAPVPLRWELQATQGQDRVRLTLVGGSDSVDVSLYPGLQGGSTIDGSIDTSVWVGDWDVVIFGNLGGALTRGPGGRPEILNGIMDARIWIDNYEDPMYSCTAANHRWSLTSR